MLSLQDQGLDSIVYLEGKTIYKKSAAVLRIMFHLNGAFAILSMIFSVFPARFRDFIYDKIAVNRYLVFGKSEVCRVPTPEEKEFFLD